MNSFGPKDCTRAIEFDGDSEYVDLKSNGIHLGTGRTVGRYYGGGMIFFSPSSETLIYDNFGGGGG